MLIYCEIRPGIDNGYVETPPAGGMQMPKEKMKTFLGKAVHFFLDPLFSKEKRFGLSI